MTVIPPFRLGLGEEEEAAVLAVLRSGQIAAGPDIEAFEQELAAAVGAGHAAAVSSGFAALHLALLALGIRPGDEVIMPCVSTCAAIRDATLAAGGVPVFADTNRDDFNLDPAAVAKRLTARTRAIISPHHTGVVSRVEEMMRFGLPVIEDCAQAIGGVVRSTLAVFSFYATKLMTTIDGGAVAGGRADLVDRVRDLRYYAGAWDAQPRFNYKMQNIGAALGRVQLRRLPAMLARRKAIAFVYRQRIPASAVVEVDVFYRFAFRVHPEQQARVLAELPCRREIGFLAPDPESYPAARQLASELLTLPCYPSMTDAEVEAVANALAAVFR